MQTTVDTQASFEVTDKAFTVILVVHHSRNAVPQRGGLRQNYLQIIADPAFQAEFWQLLTDYVGRPTPLFLAKRLSEQVGATVYLSVKTCAIPVRTRSTIPSVRY
jgi:tryptophan synthase beta chain